MALAPFVANGQLLSTLEGLLKVQQGSTNFNAPFWTRIAAAANQAAVNEIYGRLLARGFLASQIAVWDRAAEFNEDIGIFWALTRGMVRSDTSDNFIKTFDRREELMTVQVSVASVFQYPLGPPLAVGVGAFADPMPDTCINSPFWGYEPGCGPNNLY